MVQDLNALIEIDSNPNPLNHSPLVQDQKKKSWVKIDLSTLHHGLVQILLKHQVAQNVAEMTSKVLIEGDLRGYSTHGAERIFQILEGIQLKTIDPQAQSVTQVDWPAMRVVDAQCGLGYPVGQEAMMDAIQKAQAVGVGMVGVINASHLGVLSYYAELASKVGCIGIVMSTSSPAVVIKGGHIKTFGTNPIAYSIPHSGFLMTADFATSKVSRGKIYEYLQTFKDIPSHCAVDQEGQWTTSAQAALEGGLVTIDGDIKGGLISLLVSVLSGSLLGGVINPDVTGTRFMDAKPNKGDLFIALDIHKFTNFNRFLQQMEQLTCFIENQNAEFRMPGKGSHQRRQENLKEVLVPFALYQLICS